MLPPPVPTLPTPATTGDVWGNQLNSFLSVAHENSTGINSGKIKPTGIIPGTAGQILTTGSDGNAKWENLKTSFNGASTALDIASGQTQDLDAFVAEYTSINIQGDLNITNGFMILRSKGDVTISGTINVSTFLRGSYNGFQTGQAFLQNGADGLGLGGGSNRNMITKKIPYIFQPFGSSGATGLIYSPGDVTALTVMSGPSGAGGGGLIIEALGVITFTGTINADGQNALDSGSQGSSTYAVGAGGGSGGTVIFQSATGIIATSGTISAKGGNGGKATQGTASSYNIYGGGGGGGGQIVFTAPTINKTGMTTQLQGGVNGANTLLGGGNASGGGGASNGGLGGYQGASPLNAQPGIILEYLTNPIFF